MSASTRRALLVAAGSGSVLLTGAADAAWADAGAVVRKRRVYVLVTDGCRPDEITRAVTPTLHALRGGGLWYPTARSLPVMETIPNHVMMMSGVRPRRSGVPANAIYDRAARAVRTLDRPGDLRADTVLQALRRAGRTSATVLSKDYLFGIFGTRATYRWEPRPLNPVTGHAPDLATMDAALAMVRSADPDLMFVNLGDIDRFGTPTSAARWTCRCCARPPWPRPTGRSPGSSRC